MHRLLSLLQNPINIESVVSILCIHVAPGRTHGVPLDILHSFANMI